MAANFFREAVDRMKYSYEDQMVSHVDDEGLVEVPVHNEDSTSSETHDKNEEAGCEHYSSKGAATGNKASRFCFSTSMHRQRRVPLKTLSHDASEVFRQLEMVKSKIAKDADDLVERQGLLPSGTVMLKPKGKGTGDGARTFYDAGLEVNTSLTADDKQRPFFTHEHVREIEKGAFLYDPMLVQSVVDVGKRLANLDHYISDGDEHNLPMEHPQKNQIRYIDSRMTEVLLNDLEDFLQVISKMLNKMEYLREVYTSKHVEIMQAAKDAQATKERETNSQQEHQVQDDSHNAPRFPFLWWVWSIVTSFFLGIGDALWWNFNMVFLPSWFKGRLNRKYKHIAPRVYAIPHTFLKRRRQRVYGATFDAFLEVTNLGSDFAFLVIQLRPLLGTANEFLFVVSLAALILTFALRFLIGLWEWRMVDWKNKTRKRKYLLGVLLAIIEPNTGFNDLVKESFKTRESLSYNVVGDTVDTFVKDPIATQAKADFKAAQMSILTTFVLLIQDIPQIVVEFIFILTFEGGNFEFVYWLALISSLVSAGRQLIEAVELLHDVPGLRNIIHARHLVLEADYDIDLKISRALGIAEDNQHRRAPDTKPFSDAGTYDGGVEFRKGETLVAKTLCQYFNFDYSFYNCGYRVMGGVRRAFWLLETVIKVALAAPTLGRSLLWELPNLASYKANAHYFKYLQKRVVVEGKPLDDIGFAVTNRFAHHVYHVANTFAQGVSFLVSSMLWPLNWLLFERMDSRTLFRSIRSLDLTDCISTSDEVLKVISAMCPNLQNLNLSFCVDITDKGLWYFRYNRCITLGSVVLDGCIEITNEGVGHVIKSSKRSLWRLSLRDLPRLQVEVLDDIAKYCTALRSLNLDVDALYKNQHKDAFLSIQESETSKPLIELVKRCSSLQTLKLGNVLAWDDRPLKDWKEFANEVNPYIRVLSLEGAKSFTDECLGELSAKTRFLRELRLSGASKLESATCLEEHCRSLQTISLGETIVPLDQADTFFESVKMPDVEVAQIDHPRILSSFYLEQLDLQLKQYDADLQLEHYDAISTSSQKSALCWPCETSHSIEEIDDSSLHQNDKVSSSIQKIREKRKELGEFAELVKEYDSKISVLFLSMIVSLIDFARRARSRNELAPEARGYLYPDMEDRDCDQCEKLLDMVSNVLKHRGKFQDSSKSPWDPLAGIVNEIALFLLTPTYSPVVALPTFAIMPTRRLNLKIDFKWNKYEFISPDSFDSIYTLWKSQDPVVSRMTGAISKIWPISVRTPDASNTRLLQRFWYIPPEARYFCYAFPLENLDTGLDWFEKLRYDDAVLRFLHFGGFLYFDEQQHFVSASALTTGIALSFNGPYKLPKRSMAKLDKGKRWSKVTMKLSKPEDVTEVDFCFVFGGELVLRKALRKLCPHGGFAYRYHFPKKQEKPCLGVFYALAPVRDVFLRE
ncbi:F-box/LRR-repeat protein 2 [Hondaea fermentalgiana]|uniref:F-box/LRR-repeat protein 2 n=1 Tax=Hondaea fermentalgiana TaxID=2315210 RepID=A0A2R5GRV5_9STRA|nr:F-box/LRR-repeat protein 2 [Hondaea fermentalgiana]|eukprot:GBG33580.1 F-box/LRR-repeat protein 2 [Hondaea fermentalgiana]